MMKRLMLVAIAILYATTGCSNPKDANKANFKAAINEYFKTKSACIRLGRGIQFPHEVNRYSFNKSKLNKFVAIGFLSSGIIETSGYSRKTVYDLTEKGKSHFNQLENGFCFGKLRVKEITNFTEPTSKAASYYYSPFTDYTTSTVNYTAKVIDVDSWVKSKEVQNAFPSIAALYDRKKSPVQDTTVLILTNNGWVHNELFMNNSRGLNNLN